MNLSIDLHYKKAQKFPLIMNDFSLAYFNFSDVEIVNGDSFRGNIGLKSVCFPGIMDNPLRVVKESLRVYTKNSIFVSKGFRVDYFDNGENFSAWARDVHFFEPSITSPLTITQKQNFSSILFDDFNKFSSNLNLELEVINKEFDPLMNIVVSEKSLVDFRKLWDIDDKTSLEDLFSRSLNSFNQLVWDSNNGYLNVYSFLNLKSRTLCEF